MSELHQAVRRDELRVCYQPQVDLRTGRIVGVEALVRWEHPSLGLLAPIEFVPLAEESGLIVEVDTWVLREACRQAAAWLDGGMPPVRVGVNLSARHLQSPERFIGTIRDAVSDSGLPSMLLELEVTEGLAVTEDESAGAAAHPRPRREHLDRRLRHRLLDAGAAEAGRPAEDRPLVRQGDPLRP